MKKPIDKLNTFLKKEGLLLTAQPLIVPSGNRESFVVQVNIVVSEIIKPKTDNAKESPQDKD